jgi:predicted DNA-binding protein
LKIEINIERNDVKKLKTFSTKMNAEVFKQMELLSKHLNKSRTLIVEELIEQAYSQIIGEKNG